MGTRRENHNILQVLKGTSYQQRILNPAKIFFRNEGEIKVFPDEGKLRELFAGIPALWECSIRKFCKQKRNDKQWNFGTPGRKKEQPKEKSMGNTFSFCSWIFLIMFDNWSKNYTTVEYDSKWMWRKYLRQWYYKWGKVKVCEGREAFHTLLEVEI